VSFCEIDVSLLLLVSLVTRSDQVNAIFIGTRRLLIGAFGLRRIEDIHVGESLLEHNLNGKQRYLSSLATEDRHS